MNLAFIPISQRPESYRISPQLVYVMMLDVGHGKYSLNASSLDCQHLPHFQLV